MLKIQPEGYERLLGEAVFICVQVCHDIHVCKQYRRVNGLPQQLQLSCHWATMTKAEDLIVCHLIRLPSEKADHSASDVEKEKQHIRENPKRSGLMINVCLPLQSQWEVNDVVSSCFSYLYYRLDSC
ncbi:hypothetical protein MKX08_007950 [Trichoderma sp. CBMAI-0020]|nr:hypothetical protein MKX08_007950 [Trichoderma sp. CBMAI-0020]